MENGKRKKRLPIMRDPNTGRFLSNNRWHNPVAIAHERFSIGEEDLGLYNDPPEETLVINRIAMGFNEKRDSDRLRAVCKISLDPANPPATLVPDVSFIEVESFQPFLYQVHVVVEVAGRKGARPMERKCREMAAAHGVREAFVYNMDTGKWKRFAPDGNPKGEPTAHSRVLGMDLGKLV